MDLVDLRHLWAGMTPLSRILVFDVEITIEIARLEGFEVLRTKGLLAFIIVIGKQRFVPGRCLVIITSAKELGAFDFTKLRDQKT